jgi:hypothetical protein
MLFAIISISDKLCPAFDNISGLQSVINTTCDVGNASTNLH